MDDNRQTRIFRHRRRVRTARGMGNLVLELSMEDPVLVIGDARVTLLKGSGGRCVVAIEAPREVRVVRESLLEART